MGGFSIWHLLVFFFVAVPVLTFIAIWLAVRALNRSAAAAASRRPLSGGGNAGATEGARPQVNALAGRRDGDGSAEQ